MLLAILAIILTLILVIGVHEAGHALAAWFFGVKIKRIAIGFGRPLFTWKRQHGCEYVWALWPLGGFVTLLNSRTAPVASSEYPYCFDKQAIWVRIAILLAGSLANLVCAFLLFVLVFLVGISFKMPLIQQIQANSIAAQAGLKVGDQFLAINSKATPTWQDVGMQLIENWGTKNVALTVRSQKGLEKNLVLNLNKVQFSAKDSNLLNSLGIKANKQAPKRLLQASSLYDAIKQAGCRISNLVHLFFKTIEQLFMGIIPFSILLGPLGFLEVASSSFIYGLSVFLYFIATLSITVAVFNLMPLPVLDGGSIIYTVIEKIRKKPVSIAFELLIHRLLVIAFCLLLVHLFTNDLARLHL
ncbi:MAG: site-2 protease family protein [Legionella sp.]|jgi:regulator of sigma E protease